MHCWHVMKYGVIHIRNLAVALQESENNFSVLQATKILHDETIGNVKLDQAQ